MSWIIVSNRLPFQKDKNSGELVPSSGGLVSAISGIDQSYEKIWVGIAPDGMSEEEWSNLPEEKRSSFKAVFVDNELYDRYYNGICNDVLWPVFHYEGSMIHFRPEDWRAYEQINRKLAEAIAEIADKDDLVWIHDFHLFLVPKFLRELRPELKTGFFLHIPFPSSELFRQLPVREEILQGILESDLIGFHDYSYLRHFCNTILSVLAIDSNMLSLYFKGRKVTLGVFPVSIETQKFLTAVNSPEINEIFLKYKSQKNYEHLILGVDRLDYIKGIDIKLQAFRDLLINFPEYQGKVSLLQIAIPTRQDVDEYIRLKTTVESLVGEINGQFGKPNYVPVQYMFSSVSFSELTALYKLADILLVTSRRDGMNLVALEYIASQDEINPGMVILSEFAGAISTLSHAIPVNPWDIHGCAEKIVEALKMSKEEKILRNKPMLNYLKEYTASDWAESFMDSLKKPIDKNVSQLEKIIKPEDFKLNDEFEILSQSDKLIFLDYDGTIVPICSTPEEAVISEETFKLIEKLSLNEKVTLVIVSGRDSKFLNEQFKDLNIIIAAEHGAKLYNPEKKQWSALVISNKQSWFSVAEKIMQDYSLRVPGSFVEVKEYSIAWHYRLSPPEFATYQARRLKEELEFGLSNLPVTILSGNKVIEARVIEANKGYFARKLLEELKSKSKKVIAIGDDTTDEDMFIALPPNTTTIRVGNADTSARYRFSSYKDVLDFLRMFIKD